MYNTWNKGKELSIKVIEEIEYVDNVCSMQVDNNSDTDGK